MKIRLDRKIAVVSIFTVSLLSIVAVIFFLFKSPILTYFDGVFHKIDPATKIAVVPNNAPTSAPATTNSPDLTATKSAITKEPPKYSTSSKITGTTTNNADGSKTVEVLDGNLNCPDLKTFATSKPTGTTPYDIAYKDDTKSYPGLEKTLKDYLNTNLRWSNEIGSIYQISVEDVPNTNWEGLYCGAYTMNSKGDILSTYSYIILNVAYHKNSPIFTDYMKLTLSHEYGHHYSLSHKWVDLDLPASERFPDSYYSVRPLSKTTTAIDYSLGWESCESEIVAEDYSYFYSGYGYHAMSGKYGYPSSATKAWLESLSTAQKSGGQVSEQTPPSDQTPPTMSISGPASDATLSGTFTFGVDASDNVGVTKVGFYINDALIAEDATVPYEITVNSEKYLNGAYTLKAIAYDSAQSAESSVAVSFNNTPDTEKPVVTISTPSANPFLWESGDLILEATATDNRNVTRMELFVNDRSVATRDGTYIGVSFAYFEGHFENYIFKVKAYDADGNVGEATVTINK